AVGLGLTNEAQLKAKAPRKGAANPANDPAVRKALGYLARHTGNPKEPWLPKCPQANLYVLWSLERVAVIYRVPKIRVKDWYGGGGEIRVATQTADASWHTGRYYGQTPTINTCFALLFLKRANLAKDLTAKLQLGD